jgi:hypothetical protein
MMSYPAVRLLAHYFLPIKMEFYNTKQQTQAEPQFTFQTPWQPEAKESGTRSPGGKETHQQRELVDFSQMASHYC